MARVTGNTRRFGRAASAAHSRRPRQLETRLRDVTVLAGRDRIAGDLQDKGIQPIFAAGLTVQGRRDTDNRARRAALGRRIAR